MVPVNETIGYLSWDAIDCKDSTTIGRLSRVSRGMDAKLVLFMSFMSSDGYCWHQCSATMFQFHTHTHTLLSPHRTVP